MVSPSEHIQLSRGSHICLFDAELYQYMLGFARHILCGCLEKVVQRELGIQIYLMVVDHFTAIAAQIAIEQAAAWVAILLSFVATSDLIVEISPCTFGQEVNSGGQAIFPERKWTHPLNVETNWWSQQQRREKGEDANHVQEEH